MDKMLRRLIGEDIDLRVVISFPDVLESIGRLMAAMEQSYRVRDARNECAHRETIFRNIDTLATREVLCDAVSLIKGQRKLPRAFDQTVDTPRAGI